ncbi:MAG: hypothetical protein K0S20_591 [Patescibacteria group bacterium]|jgi:hypothetical protein|nr:hypothetical protein [Patescibacteria group bacterium]
MKKNANVGVQVEEKTVHPLQKSYMIVSKRHVDYENLTAFEAMSMSAVFVLAVTVGVLQSLTIA